MHCCQSVFRSRLFTSRRSNFISFGFKMGFEEVKLARSCRSYSFEAKEEDNSRSYKNAIKALNCLVTNAAFIQQSITGHKEVQSTRISETIKYLNRVGIQMKEIEQLKIVHVSGTKGKGSTCALVESILRHQGYRTGFFSSPHLVSVTERIRLQGQSISKLSFANYFWTIFDRLKENADCESDMPPYFQFLTIMSLYVFLHENIDVAIIEVGIGGEHDCTNVKPNTKTVGITSLGLDHVQILGDTLEKIAWQKAGIIKPGSDVFTTKQADDCMSVIEKRAKEKNANFYVVPNYSDYKWVSRQPNLQFDIEVQKLNMSLAIQLAFNWMHHYQISNNVEVVTKNKSTSYKILLELPETVTIAIEQCYWPGRCQYLQYRAYHFYIDGAHTLESLQVCSEWFKKASSPSVANHKKILVFNVTGNRNVESMLELLNSYVNYDAVFFVPNLAKTKPTSDDNMEKDLANPNVLVSCQKICDQWQQIRQKNKNHTSDKYVKEPTTHIAPSVFDMLTYLDNSLDGHSADLLITGSLHLVGAFMLGLEEFDKVVSQNDQKIYT